MPSQVLTSSNRPISYYRHFRKTLERVPMLRGAISHAVQIKNSLMDSTERDRLTVEQLYRATEDPYAFGRDSEQFRFQRAAEILDQARRGRLFRCGLEVGCAEGMFTEYVAERCETVLSVDLSTTALQRARQRCHKRTNVTLAEWDLRKDPLENTFDLIVATGVLEYIFRPSTLRRACDRLVSALNPGGYLLVGNTVVDVERTWIGRLLIRGSLINHYIGSDPRLEFVFASVDQCALPFAHLLLRKRRNEDTR